MEEVVLVDNNDREIGTMEKLEAHEKGALHRAFSVFLFNESGELLLQQRAVTKYHSGGLWTNTCCSHPRPGESSLDAANRRLTEELGFTAAIEKVFHFVYRADFDNGLTEHEFDHVFVGKYTGQQIVPDPQEVMDTVFMDPLSIRRLLQTEPSSYTAWFHIAFPKVYEWWNKEGFAYFCHPAS